MNRKHWRLQAQILSDYRKKGYEVGKEVTVNDEENERYWVVDVIAEKGEENVAIEIGSANPIKVAFLRKNFSKVVLVPYVIRTSDGLIIHKLCGHKWLARVETPQECPKCKGRLYLT